LVTHIPNSSSASSVEGRSFLPSDAVGAPVVLINRTMAKTFWKGESAIGHRLNPNGQRNPVFFTIVGVVRDVKQGGLDAKTGTELFFNAPQLPRTAGFAYGQMNTSCGRRCRWRRSRRRCSRRLRRWIPHCR
jgi:hypothetical protein